MYLPGIKHHHQLAGLPHPIATSIRLPLVLRGIRRRGLRLPPKPRLPITIKIMGELKCVLQERLDLSTDNCRMYWAAFTTVLFGFLPCLEYTAPSPSHFDKDRTLLRSDLTIDNNGYQLHIKESKMDPFRLGVDLFLSRSHHSVCPVKALEKYMARSRSRVSDLPLFSHADGYFLTPLRLTSMLRSLLHKLGFNEDQYAGHSFWIGVATTAAAAGLPDWLIKTLDR